MTPGIELGVVIHVHPGIELNGAPEWEARVAVFALPVKIGIQPRPGTVDTKVQVGVDVDIPVPRSSELQLEQVGL
jgi:hypothetical protein